MFRLQMIARSIFEGRVRGMIFLSGILLIGMLVIILATDSVSAGDESGGRVNAERHAVVIYMKGRGCDIIDLSKMSSFQANIAKMSIHRSTVSAQESQDLQKTFCKPVFNF